MQFKFTKIDYQESAINAIVGVFEGAEKVVESESFFRNIPTSIIPNTLNIDLGKIANNLHQIQLQNNITSTAEELTNQKPLDFSVEMETGTGKTYVYLSTILRLNKEYGLKKFIILVPSVAIREGVLKTIQQTREHFRDLYNTGFGYCAYDSDKLSQVRDFVQSNDVQIMIMTIQSFNKDTTVMRQNDRDDTYGQISYLDMVAQTRPVVIMDEPQNMESELAQVSISDLNPLFKLRYSATHKNIHNLVYRLTPVDAYRKNLVKKISVYGVKEHNPEGFLFQVTAIETKKGENPKAKALIEVKLASGDYESKEVPLSAGDNLFIKSKRNIKYENVFVSNIYANTNQVELSNGQYYKLSDAGENKEVIFRTQIRETIRAHFIKQQEVGDRLKVLSLFFIDKVDNYVAEEGLVKKLFIEEFKKLQEQYPDWKDVDVTKIHKGYFASKKTRGNIEYKESTGRESKEDREAYDLIMKEKERLLSFAEPVSFIFSHSALKEGWDNPNIFQICTLRETQSVMKKRQEIGRGLRLPVDVQGNRIHDPEINVLTVVANASYEEYARGLQEEFKEAGYQGDVETRNAREERITVKTTKHLDSEEFKELWKRISKRTKFSLEVFTDQLIKKSIEKINEITVNSIAVMVERGQVFFDKDGNIDRVRESSGLGYSVNRTVSITNIVNRITQEIHITRKTVFDILSKVENLDLVFENSEEYIRQVIKTIKEELNNLLVNEGLKYIPIDDVWEINLFHDFEAFPSKLIPSERSVFDHVVFDSKGEKEFAEKLENFSRVKVYTKLPRGFVVDTPLGNYVPDWAIVYKADEGEKLYLVRETKFEYENLDRDLSWEEKGKIEAARKHFAAIDVNYDVAESKELLDLVK